MDRARTDIQTDPETSPRESLPAATPYVRYAAGVVSAGCLALIAVTLYFAYGPQNPADRPVVLRIPPCGFLEQTGYPCPSCGMTTAFVLLAKGRVIESFNAQPLGFLLAVATVALAVMSAITAATGRLWNLPMATWPWWGRLLVVVGLFFGAWGYKVLTGILNGTYPIR